MEDVAVHPLILVSQTLLHDRMKITECRKIDTVTVCACVVGGPDVKFTYGFYTHDFILPN